jgi:PAS domain S-box-containing protein
MLQKRLIILLLLLILMPTLVIGWMAYRFSIDNIRSERINIVGQVAENRHEQLNMVLQRANLRTHAYLSDVLSKCITPESLDETCAAGFLNDFLHTEGAEGVLFFRNANPENSLQIGKPTINPAQLVEFQPGQIAGISDLSPKKHRFYYVVVSTENLPWRLVVSYPISLIQPIFGPHADLGRSGETFLADRNGFFITQAAYPSTQGHSHPISAQPMQSCLSQQNDQMLDRDYRGEAVIHGFRYVPEIGGGCIMAHIDQTEAFDSLRKLEKQLVIAVAIFLILTTLTARALARRIIKPILRLTNTARRIRDGDNSIRAVVSGHDEISELASSFNHMTESLADAQHNLEAKVVERTRELMTSQERYMLAERAVNDGIWDWDIVNHAYYLSPRWNKILGYGEGDLPNVESIFFDLIHPDDKKSASEAFRRHLENQERYNTELRLRHKDGSYRWVLDRGEAIRDDQGNPVRMVGSITDITERKAAEAMLLKYREHLEELVAMATTEVKAIVQTAVNGVITIDTSGEIRLFNPAAERLFGWTAEEVIGRNVSLLMPEPMASEHDGYIQRFLQSREARIIGIEREVTAKRKDGQEFPANLAVGHATLVEGRHLFVAFISDISAQKQAEQELRLAKDAAEAAAKAKANFLANMSHEIRTPMNTVIGFAEVVLQNPLLPTDTRKHVATILNSGKHLLSVINDILDFSKIEAGKVDLEAVCFNLPSAVQDSLQIMSLRASEKGLRIELNVEAGLPQYFVGDPNRLRQVILNLVGNAVKFTESGLISVQIEKAADPEMLHFCISDSGIGMTPEQTKTVFEPFSQADTTTSRRFGGTGLGTTISKQLVELMGGRIWVESEFGQGSKFHFTVRMPDTTQQDSCLYQTIQNLSEYFSPRCFKILLAEDIEANASLAILRLEQQGHRVSWVKNGQEAVEAFDQGEYDIILMDLQMPVLDGVNATRQIRAREQFMQTTIPILALTASVLQHEREECRQAGIDAIVGKPIDINELLEQMERLVPQGKGQARTAITIINKPVTAIDFSPIAGVAAVDKGLSAWQEPLVYAKALRDFAENHQSTALEMARLLAENPDQVMEVERMAHALKGVVGNLALTDVYKLVSTLDTDLKTAQTQTIPEQLASLDAAIKKACTAITALQVEEHPPIQPKLAFDALQVEQLLLQLLRVLDSLNPDAIEPVLQQLQVYLGDSELKAIRHEIDGFDFDAAKLEVKKLSEQLRKTDEGDLT